MNFFLNDPFFVCLILHSSFTWNSHIRMCTNYATTNYLVNTLIKNKPNQFNTLSHKGSFKVQDLGFMAHGFFEFFVIWKKCKLVISFKFVNMTLALCETFWKLWKSLERRTSHKFCATKVFGHKNHGLYYQGHHCSRRRKLKKEKLCKKRKIVHKKGSPMLMKYKSIERDQEDTSQSMVN